MSNKYVSYVRVSSDEQGRSGLGLEAQRTDILGFINRDAGKLVQEFEEVQSGADDARPELARALELARITGAALVVSKICRLSRDAAFTLAVLKSGVPVICADMPHADPTMTGIRAVLAQNERELISSRTKDALRAAKARGTVLGGWRGQSRVDPALGRAARSRAADSYAASVGPHAAELRHAGLSLREIAAAMAARDIRTPAGGGWSAGSVRLLLLRHDRIVRETS